MGNNLDKTNFEITKKLEQQEREKYTKRYNNLNYVDFSNPNADKISYASTTSMKQETIEEVAEIILANNIDGLKDALKDDDLFFFYKGIVQRYGEVMVKWQQEQDKKLYSEEDMAESFMACWKANVPEGFECKLSFKEWFEQFKKK